MLRFAPMLLLLASCEPTGDNPLVLIGIFFGSAFIYFVAQAVGS